MRIFEHTIWIARPREAVFDYFTDWSAAPEWRSYVRSMNPATAGPVQAGSTINVVMDVAGEEYAFTLSVVTFERPSLWRHKTNETDFNGFIEYRFEPEANGTRVTMSCVVKPISVYGWLGLPLIWLRGGKSYREQLPKLKSAMESAR
jgi:uncharacterized protein YndB with AHSA1/START domain